MDQKRVLLVIGIVGAALVGVSQLPHLTWQGVMGVVGGVLMGIPVMLQRLGQFHLDDLPQPMAEAVRESVRPPPGADGT